jgi:AAA domain
MATNEQTVVLPPTKEPGNPEVSQYEKDFGVWSAQTAIDKGWKIMLYGAAGSGKTYMAGTFPDPIFLDLEDGMRSVLPLNKKILRYPKDSSVPVTELKQVKSFFDAIKKIPPSKAPFKTIVVDSLNELQVLVMKNVLSTIDTNRIYEDQPTQGDYGKLARDMQSIVRDFIQLPYNVVFTAAATDREYQDDKVFPKFVGRQTGPDLRRIIEQIGYCFTQQKSKDAPVEHMVGFGDCPSYSAKDRTGKLSSPIRNTYTRMSETANGIKGATV